ncbi:hypothetical protein ANTPLA_LOCUS2887 [Anthophora plagiata]
MMESKIDVAIISEPPKEKAKGWWITSTDGKAAIYMHERRNKAGIWIQEEGFVACMIKGIIIISAYFSPNRNINEFEIIWERIVKEIQRAKDLGKGQIMVAGDLPLPRAEELQLGGISES